MASTTLTRTPSSNGNQKTWTLSFWIKKCANGGQPTILDAYYGNQSRYSSIYFTSSDTLDIFSGVYTTGSSTTYLYQYTTNRVFRDTNAWYHIVVSVDTTQATAGDRVKLYVNGVRETSFGTETQPTQNGDSFMNVTTSAMRMGINGLDAVLSHVHWVDGTAYDADTFGETDSTTGEWKIKTSPSVTYGTNGFFIFKDSSSITDQSGNSNNLTVSAGTLTDTEDCPSDTFATLNPLNGNASGGTFANGNTTGSTTSNAWVNFASTLGNSSGKFYAEYKCVAHNSGAAVQNVGLVTVNNTRLQSGSTEWIGLTGGNFAYNTNGRIHTNATYTNSWGDSWTTGDIIGVAMDLDNQRLFFSKNGTWQNSADPTTSTGAITIDSDVTYLFIHALYGSSQTGSWNFGNGYFGSTAISSEGTNASGIGKFEYDVPTGYTALSTKGLNE